MGGSLEERSQPREPEALYRNSLQSCSHTAGGSSGGSLDSALAQGLWTPAARSRAPGGFRGRVGELGVRNVRDVKGGVLADVDLVWPKDPGWPCTRLHGIEAGHWALHGCSWGWGWPHLPALGEWPEIRDS